MKTNQVVVVLDKKTYVKAIRVIVCDADENAQIAEPRVGIGINLYGEMLWKDSLWDQMKTWPFVKVVVMVNTIRNCFQLKQLHGLHIAKIGAL